MKIGVVGFSSDAIDSVRARILLEQSFKQLLLAKGAPDDTAQAVEIVTGFTNIGVPKLAYQIADSWGYTTVGISAQQAYRVRCGIYPVKKAFIVGDNFGDESQAFIDYIDYLVAVCGGTQSQREIVLFTEKCLQNHWAVSERLIIRALDKIQGNY
ncbi:hypothetical protein P886_0873 [Alteromonadaceae bacterium 2753L.S.0a.02]|nr:hypothetical protein P886_0873 [Alteromonadaceae bacterium 2753L.S.0a.02]